jgi:hypothetical protein
MLFKTNTVRPNLAPLEEEKAEKAEKEVKEVKEEQKL